jgi:branched-chain amino acid transport system substrate-binding protein
VNLVVDQINPPNQQGLLGHPLEVVVCDDQVSPTLAANFAQRFVGEGVQAIMSGDSSETLSVAAVTVPAGVLLLSGYSVSIEITNLDATVDGVRLIWRTIESDAVVATVLNQEIVDDAEDAGTDLPRVGPLLRNDAYGQGFYSTFQPAYTGAQQAFFFDPTGDNDVSCLTSENTYQPQLSILWGLPADIDQLLNDIEAGTGGSYPNLLDTSWYFCGQMLVPGTLNALSDPSQFYGQRVVAPAPYDATSPAFVWFQNNYQQVYGQNPALHPSVASYADAMMLIAIAAGTNVAENLPTSGVNLAKVLGEVSSPTASADAGTLLPLDPPNFTLAVQILANGQAIQVQGASGPLDFDPSTGEAPSTTFVYEIDGDGGFSVIRSYPPP